ncbi:unnamed protein product [Plutella xylostella]|uniref:(diamondback moth) hypothetical protein n=1 Tax=Plutella xylostella TaxID=51655 RepID=A0A8S4G6E0_PLUXY|nr:unnamed protein product [Plutella xylostella]
MCKSFVKALFLVFTAVISCDGQSEFMLPFGPDTLRQIIRTKTPLPSGRKATLSDVRLHYYGGNSTEDVKTYRLNTIQDVLQESSFDSEKPTVFYAHGFVELAEDESVRTVVGAYLRAGGHNVVVVDWANLGFGSYLQAGRNVQLVGRDLGRRLLKLTTLGLPAMRLHLVGHSLGAHLVAYAARQMKTKDVTVPRRLLKLTTLGLPVARLHLMGHSLGAHLVAYAARQMKTKDVTVPRRLLKLTTLGLPASRLHLVGHSLGAHLVAYAARQMKTKDVTVPRITGLDPAMPGFYPPLSFLGDHVTADDAAFVDIIHTDGGRYGASSKTGHADFWPNGGTARQPGCQINTVLFTYEDFCGHWRSWRFWAESLAGPAFDSRPCTDYEAFTRGECKMALVAYMGEKADKDLRGNFYLRTAGTKPFSLGARGAE